MPNKGKGRGKKPQQQQQQNLPVQGTSVSSRQPSIPSTSSDEGRCRQAEEKSSTDLRGRGKKPQQQPNLPVKGTSVSSRQPSIPSTSSDEGRCRQVEEKSSTDLSSTKTNPSDNELVMAKRPSHSTAYKKKIPITTNVYRLEYNSDCAYHYDVDISPLDIIKKSNSGKGVLIEKKPVRNELCHLIIFELLRMQKDLKDYKPVFDGKKNMFSSKRLPIPHEGQEFTQTVYLDGKQKKFLVIIKPVRKGEDKDNKISFKPLAEYMSGKSSKVPEEVSLVFNAILAYRKITAKEFHIRNAFFPTDLQSRIKLGDGYDMLLGYNQTIKFSEKGAAVVINVKAAAFHQSGPVIARIESILRRKIEPRTVLHIQDVKKIEKKFKDLRVEVIHQKFKRKYMIHSLGDPANKQKFEFEMPDKTKKMITVEEYFFDAYGKKLNFPNLPCLLNKKPNKKQVYLPMEFCNILPNQRLKNLDEVAGSMIKHSAIAPQERQARISNHAENIQSETRDHREKFGLQINLKPVESEGRVLNRPEIRYVGKTVVPNERGTWNMGEFAQSAAPEASPKKWWLVSLEGKDNCNPAKINNFANFICRVGRKYGLNLDFPQIKICDNSIIETLIVKAMKSVDLIVVILSQLGEAIEYSTVKFYGDTIGIPTQCVTSDLVAEKKKKLDENIIVNICLKLNSKLGGVNHGLSEWPLALHKEGVIVFGADVVHSVGSVCPSIAAVVASVDFYLSKYAVSCRAQLNPKGSGRTQEIIINLKEMVIVLLKKFYIATSKMKPQKILFYRDGVSYGQFRHVFEQEVPMIKEACRSLEANYQPPITFVIVQKRHDVRIFPSNPARDGIGRQGNIPAGTAVDRDIVDPVNFDLYLCSHEGIMGTSKPTHYTVLFNENNVTPEVIEKLTYFLTHVYARCNRSIAIPAPVKYADLLAYRANQYVQCRYKQTRKIYEDQDDIPAEIKDLIKSIESSTNQMFFI